jgi:hypothetical protein
MQTLAQTFDVLISWYYFTQTHSHLLVWIIICVPLIIACVTESWMLQKILVGHLLLQTILIEKVRVSNYLQSATIMLRHE